jgi:hypothetical protein
MKKIRNLLLLLLVCTTTLVLTGCGEKNVEGKLDEIMEKVYKEMYAEFKEDERPALMTTNALNPFEDATQEDIDLYINNAIGEKAKDIEYEEIVYSEPQMSSIAYSVVLVRMKDGANIEEAKTKIKESVNPRKWMCVEVAKEDIIVKNKGDLIIVIMVSDEKLRETIEEGFDNL